MTIQTPPSPPGEPTAAGGLRFGRRSARRSIPGAHGGGRVWALPSGAARGLKGSAEPDGAEAGPAIPADEPAS